MNLQQQIEEAREKVDRLFVEAKTHKQAWDIAESRLAGACLELHELLQEARRENSEQAPHLKAGEHFAYPNGRAEAIN